MRTIELMYPVVKAMLDEVCEVAKQEMKEKGEEELGSWKHAVTTADGTWQTRGWHSKNATFTIRIPCRPLSLVIYFIKPESRCVSRKEAI